jgi:nucleotide-binding universal stress UspA family protein
MTEVLLAVDGSPCSEAAVDAVIRQFSPEQTHVRLLHVVTHPESLSPAVTFTGGPTAARDVLACEQSARHRSEELLAHVVERLRIAGFRASAEIRDGDPDDEILACAALSKSEVIVVGSHGRRGLNRLVNGSVSTSVLRRAPCAVEVVPLPTDTAPQRR